MEIANVFNLMEHTAEMFAMKIKKQIWLFFGNREEDFANAAFFTYNEWPNISKPSDLNISDSDIRLLEGRIEGYIRDFFAEMAKGAYYNEEFHQWHLERTLPSVMPPVGIMFQNVLRGSLKRGDNVRETMFAVGDVFRRRADAYIRGVRNYYRRKYIEYVVNTLSNLWGGVDYRCIYSQHRNSCEKCRALRDQIFPLENAETGLNAPPIHPNCGCGIEVLDADGNAIINTNNDFESSGFISGEEMLAHYEYLVHNSLHDEAMVVLDRMVRMIKNKTYTEINDVVNNRGEGWQLLEPGTGTLSDKGRSLLIAYEYLGSDYMVYDENGVLVAILSRDVEGRGNITFGHGVLFRNTPEDRARLKNVYGLEFAERVPVSPELAEQMMRGFINNEMGNMFNFLRNNDIRLNQNQLDALIIYRYLAGSLGGDVTELLVEMFDGNDGNDPNIENYYDRMLNAMIDHLRDRRDFHIFERGWTNRILDILELFFDGDAERNH